MQYLDYAETLKVLCHATNKLGMYVRFYFPDDLAAEDHIPELSQAMLFFCDDYYQMLVDKCGYFLFDTEEELLTAYQQIVGDDGPTALNKYNGCVRVYALTAGPEGLRHENT